MDSGDSRIPVGATLTVTVAEAEIEPEVAVIAAVPLPTAVSKPVRLTEATPGLELVQVTAPNAAPAGCGVAVICCVAPTLVKVTSDGVRRMPVRAIFTVTVALAETEPDVAVTVVVPGPTAVTRPAAFTVATLVSELLQVTTPREALDGTELAVSWCVAPTELSVTFAGDNVMPERKFTTTVAVPDTDPEVAVIVALPLPTAVTNPVLLTVAMPGSVLVHVTVPSAAAAGTGLAVSCWVAPRAVKVTLPGVMLIPVRLGGSACSVIATNRIELGVPNAFSTIR